jgi:ABC-2 type transport system ATP-binding protein
MAERKTPKRKPATRPKPATRKPAPRPKRPTAITATDLVRVFKGGVRAVDGIDLEVAEGEIYGFLGPNGAGKSTTVLMLTTLLPPTAGSATVGGYDVAHQGADVRRVIGAALQEAALDPNLTGREHIRMQATLHGIDRTEADRLAKDLLERVGLTEAADRRTVGYSGGMRRRLDLALALVHRPRILFLDEPTTGLDVQSRTALWDEVRQLAHEDGVTIFLTTQYLEEADALADRVGIIDRGKIVAEDTPAKLKAQIGRPTVEVTPEKPTDRPKVERAIGGFGEIVEGSRRDSVAVRIKGVDALTRVVRALDKAKLRVANVELHAPTLADVFLAKTGRRLEGASEDGTQAERSEAASPPRRRR